MRSSPRKLSYLVALAALAILVSALAGCSKKSSLVTGPETGTTQGVGVMGLRASAGEIGAAMRAQNAHSAALFKIGGVVGNAITADENGRPAILVLTEHAMGGRLPATLDGYRVIEMVTGKIVAYKGGGGGGAGAHQSKQTPPIQLGTSGGNAFDLANGYCCSGTLGALVNKGGQQHILSNSHVFAGDVTNGGNGRQAQIGDDITQPGLIDNNCNAGTTNLVADLSSLSSIFPVNTSNVDAAIAQVRPGMVRTDGAILGIGTISASTVGASLGQAVKKSGRTTGLTRSTVNGLNANVNVGYSNECAGGSFTKSFTGQIFIANNGSKFLNSGDSGSLMVEDVTTNPRAVGLLYAGGGGVAVANPINAVLSHLGATMVGQ